MTTNDYLLTIIRELLNQKELTFINTKTYEKAI